MQIEREEQGAAEETAAEPRETVFSILAERARSAPPAHLLVALGLGAADSLAGAHRGALWVTLIGVSVAAYGIWGLADRALLAPADLAPFGLAPRAPAPRELPPADVAAGERPMEVGEVRSPRREMTLRTLRVVAAVGGGLAAVGVVLSLLQVMIGGAWH